MAVNNCVCLACGKAFHCMPAQIKRGRGKCCSRKCAEQHRYRNSVADRFWANVDKNGPVPAVRPELGSCWTWLGRKCRGGYGCVKINGVVTTAHRADLGLVGRPVPDELEADHLCRNRACVNPDHLEAVTSKVNLLRGEGACAKNARKTHCSKGHPFDKENTSHRKRGTSDVRVCKACRRLEYRQRRLAPDWKTKNRDRMRAYRSRFAPEYVR